MDLSNVKIVKQADFSEGYAPALAEDKNYYIVGEDGSVTPTKYHSIGSIPNEVSFSGFDNGVCLVLSEDHQVNYQLPTLHHTSARWLTRAGYPLGDVFEDDLRIVPDTQDVISNLRGDTPRHPELVDVAKKIFANPNEFFNIDKKFIKKSGLIRNAEDVKALCDVARHSLECELEKTKKAQATGEKTYIDYELCLAQIKEYVEKIKQHLEKTLAKSSKILGEM